MLFISLHLPSAFCMPGTQELYEVVHTGSTPFLFHKYPRDKHLCFPKYTDEKISINNLTRLMQLSKCGCQHGNFKLMLFPQRPELKRHLPPKNLSSLFTENERWAQGCQLAHVLFLVESLFVTLTCAFSESATAPALSSVIWLSSQM